MCNTYSGLTVNERLYKSGKICEFDNAVKDRDFDKIREILQHLCVDVNSINHVIKELKKPSKQPNNYLSHGVLGGTSSALQGGTFKSGFIVVQQVHQQLQE